MSFTYEDVTDLDYHTLCSVVLSELMRGVNERRILIGLDPIQFTVGGYNYGTTVTEPIPADIYDTYLLGIGDLWNDGTPAMPELLSPDEYHGGNRLLYDMALIQGQLTSYAGGLFSNLRIHQTAHADWWCRFVKESGTDTLFPTEETMNAFGVVRTFSDIEWWNTAIACLKRLKYVRVFLETTDLIINEPYSFLMNGTESDLVDYTVIPNTFPDACEEAWQGRGENAESILIPELRWFALNSLFSKVKCGATQSGTFTVPPTYVDGTKVGEKFYVSLGDGGIWPSLDIYVGGGGPYNTSLNTTSHEITDANLFRPLVSNTVSLSINTGEPTSYPGPALFTGTTSVNFEMLRNIAYVYLDLDKLVFV